MRIIFVRHGHPDYANDCLTALGHRHAEAASLRLLEEGIGEIFSSSCGRAAETAAHTADKLGLPVKQFDFIREIYWGARDGEAIAHNGHPWFTAQDEVKDGHPLMRQDWRETAPFDRNIAVDSAAAVAAGIDEWLKTLGYTREGDYYRVTGENTGRTVAMFSHAGAASAALSHMFNLPFPYFCCAIEFDYTSITVVRLSDEAGALTMPAFELVNDAKHIQKIPNVIGN